MDEWKMGGEERGKRKEGGGEGEGLQVKRVR
jgi:hypothetical protein